MRGHLDLVRHPGAGRLVGASVIARLSFGLFDFALIVLVQRATNSFAVAGAAIGAHALGIAASAPLRGRLLDRRGARATLPPLVAVYATATAALPVAALTGSSVLLLALSALSGLSVPPLVPAMRLEWQRLLASDEQRLQRAYAFETVVQLAVYVVGPLLAAAGVALSGADAVIVVAAAIVVGGTVAFAALARAPVHADARLTTGLGPIRVPGVLTLVIVVTLGDAALGVVDVAVVAAAAEAGATAAGGVLLALFATGSVLGGAVYGARTWRASPARRLGAIMALFALALLVLAPATGTLWLLGALLVVAGAPSAAQWVTTSLTLDTIAPRGANADAFTWLSTANAIGLAVGGVLAGALIELDDASAAFIGAAGCAATALLALAARRATLRP